MSSGGSCPDPQARGYRHDRQSSGAQGRRCPLGDRSARCDASLSAQIFTGTVSSRCLSASSRLICARPPSEQFRACAAEWTFLRSHYPRSFQLFQACRLCVKSTGIALGEKSENGRYTHVYVPPEHYKKDLGIMPYSLKALRHSIQANKGGKSMKSIAAALLVVVVFILIATPSFARISLKLRG